MTHFKIVCTGWKNWPWVKQTVESIEGQTHSDYDVCLSDDCSDIQELSEYLLHKADENHWHCILREDHYGTLYNQVHAIRSMDPDPEDVIVFLDPDGDRFAHPNVLNRLEYAYSDGSRVVWSQYECDPPSPTSTPSCFYPRDVVRRGNYREFTLKGGGHTWNHLRTFKADMFLQMDESDFKDDDGNWFMSSPDSALMFPAIELARGRIKFFDEVLLTYRPDHELSDWKKQPKQIDRDHGIILRRSPKC